MAYRSAKSLLCLAGIAFLAPASAGCAADEVAVGPAAPEEAGSPEAGPSGSGDGGTDAPVKPETGAGVPDSGSGDIDVGVEAPPPSKNYEVWVTSHGFEPANIKIAKGDTVTWKWFYGPRSITSGFLCMQDYLFDSGPKTSPATWTLAFPVPGPYPYYSAESCNTFIGSVSVGS